MAKKTNKRRRPYTPTSVRGMLNVIDRFLVKNNEQDWGSKASQLWDVLSALRGPDSRESVVKGARTIPIRRAAFPLVAKKDDDTSDVRISASFAREYTKYEAQHADGSYHFNNHTDRAARVLGLIK